MRDQVGAVMGEVAPRGGWEATGEGAARGSLASAARMQQATGSKAGTCASLPHCEMTGFVSAAAREGKGGCHHSHQLVLSSGVARAQGASAVARNARGWLKRPPWQPPAVQARPASQA